MIGSNSDNNINSALNNKSSVVFAKRIVKFAYTAVYNHISMNEQLTFIEGAL